MCMSEDKRVCFCAQCGLKGTRLSLHVWCRTRGGVRRAEQQCEVVCAGGTRTMTICLVSEVLCAGGSRAVTTCLVGEVMCAGGDGPPRR